MASPMKVTTSGNFKIKDKDGNVVEQFSDKVEVQWNSPDSLQEAIDMYGEDTVFELFERNAVIKIQNEIRNALGNKVPHEEIQRTFADWKPEPGRRRAPGAPKQSIDDQFESMSPEEQIALIQRLQAKAAARAGGAESLAGVEE